MNAVRAFVFIAAMGLSFQSKADLAFEIESTSLPVGGTGTLNVFLSSSSGTTVFNSIDVEFYIATLSGTSTPDLNFLANESESYVNDPQYVFYSNSLAQTNGDEVTRTSFPYAPEISDIRLYFTDQTNDGTNVAIQENERFLLGTFDLIHTNSFADPETFVISVSGFIYRDVNVFVPTVTPFGFVNATAVPEPSSGAMLGLCLMEGIRSIRRRRNILTLDARE